MWVWPPGWEGGLISKVQATLAFNVEKQRDVYNIHHNWVAIAFHKLLFFKPLTDIKCLEVG